VLKPTGHLLDGTPIHEAISDIDSKANPPPFFYMANCVHPRVFERAIGAYPQFSGTICERMIGLAANASTRSPEELEGLGFLDSGHPESFSDSMIEQHHRFGTRILGGCCGTDQRHIEGIASRISAVSSQ
jgi:homocysteine S-methyltransferase